MLSLVIFGTFLRHWRWPASPLMISLLATTAGIVVFYGMQYPLESVFLSFIGGVEPFILIAVPLFVFTGELLAQGGVGKRIVEFAHVLFGWLPGGLGVVTVISCLLFGGVSGSAIADTAAIGSLVIPAMLAQGYSSGFAAALVAVAGTLALLMPLSIPFLVYAFVSGVSMRTLSMAGLVPALARHRLDCRVHVARQEDRRGPRRETAPRSAQSGPPPRRRPGPADAGLHRRRHLVRLLHADRGSGGRRGLRPGRVDVPLQGSALQDLPHLLLKAFMTSATVMLVIGATGALAWLITAERWRSSWRTGSVRWRTSMGLPDHAQRGAGPAGHLHRAAAGAADDRAAVPAAGHGVQDGPGAHGRDHDGQPGDRAVHAAGRAARCSSPPSWPTPRSARSPGICG